MRRMVVSWSLLVACLALPATAEPAPPSLSMEVAVSAALQNHPTLQAAGFTAQAAGERVGQAASGWNPTLTLRGSVDHSDNLAAGVGGDSPVLISTAGTAASAGPSVVPSWRAMTRGPLRRHLGPGANLNVP